MSNPLPPESWQTRLMRWRFNLFPAFRRTGGRVLCISADQRFVRVKLPLNFATKNYVGTIYGGCMYAAVDPFYMVMFLRLLGPGYVVWDINGHIEHLKPGRSTLTADIHISVAEIDRIRSALSTQRKMTQDYTVELIDEHAVVHARITKTLYFARKK